MEASYFCLAAFLVLCHTAATTGHLVPPAGPRKLQYEVADSFKVLQSFPHGVAVVDSDNDTMFNCWTAARTAIDSDSGTASYMAFFPRIQKAIPFHVKAEKNSPKFTFTIDDDPTPKEGVFYYTDYENCLIKDMEYHGHQCVLWVRQELKNSVPQNCLDYYADICGVGFPEYSRDLCRAD